jgi:PAS domain S-box-containing protein
METSRKPGSRKAFNDIAKERQVESEVKQSRTYLQKIIDELDEVIMLNEPDGKLSFVNQAYTRVLGYPIDELLGKRPEEQEHFFSEEDKKTTTELVDRVLQGEKAMGEVAYRHKDGRRVHTKLMGKPLKLDESVGALWTIVDITELKKKEKELKETNAMYDTIFNNSTAPCVITDRDWRWSRVNPAFELLTGYSAKEILGRFDYEMPFWTEEEVTRLRENVKNKKPGEPISVEILVNSKDGENLHVLLNEVFVEEEVSRKVGWVSYLTDITELRKREEELKHAKLFSESIINSSTVPIMVTDKNWKWISVNPAFEKLLGYKPEEILGKSRHELPIWTPEEYERAEDTANQLIEKIGMDKPIEFETLLRTKDGRDLNILLREVFLGEEISKEIGFIGYLFDITELKKREAELDEARMRLEGIVANMADALCVVDNEGKWLMLNPAMARIIGYSEEEILGKRTQDQPFTQLPETKEANLKLWEKVGTDGRAAGIEIPWVRKDGQKIIVSCSEQLLRQSFKDVKGNTAGRVFIARDVTELKRATQEVAQALGALSSGDLTRKVGVSGLSGDLREMGESINKSLDSLNTLIKGAKSVAQMVSSTSQSLSASAEELSASTNQISGTVAQIAQGATDQASHIERVRKAAIDLTELSGRGALEADSAAKETTRAAEEALVGSKAAKEAIDRTKRIFNVTSESALVVKSLGELTEEIGATVEVITSIAGQTNLLSLNAAIEAARAGEQGRAFAVVAEEVKKLAEESKQSAKKITGMVKRIELERAKAVSSMDSGLKEVTEGGEVINEALNALDKIASLVGEIAGMSQTILEVNRKQKEAAEMISKSIEEISTVAEENAAGAEETSASTEEETVSMEELTATAQELASMAENLARAVAKFKILEMA